MSPPAKRSSTNTREKDIMLDKDREKDDFISWSMKSHDDPMDFGFELPGNNKKNAFKLDMGFDLDGDFGKLSSFKMDMPDFDFSSPPEKATKAKESSDDKSGGNFRQKKDLFAFSYDFDALDGFDLGSSPPKKASDTTTKTMDCEEIVAGRKIEKPEALDFDLDLPISRQAVFMASTDVKADTSSEKENQNSKTSDTLVVDNITSSKQAPLDSMANSKAVESPQSPRKNDSQTHTIGLQPRSADTPSLKASCPMVEEIDEPCPSNETAALSPSDASETVHTAVNRENSPDIDEEARSSVIKGNCPRDSDQHAYNQKICTPGSSYEKPEPDISAQLCLDMTEQQQEEMCIDKAEIGDESKRELCDPDIGHPQTTPSGKISSGTRPSQTSQVQDSSAKLPLALSNSECSLRGVKDLKAMQNKDSGLIRSRFFKNPEQPESRVLEPSPTRTESRSITQESIGLILNPTIDRRRDIKDVLPGSKTRACPVELVNTDSEKNAAKDKTSNSHEKIIHKDHSDTKTVENLAGQLDRSKLQTKNTTKERSILQLDSSSKLDVSSLTQKLSTNLSSGVEPVQKSKLVSLERPKLVNIMSDLRGSKTQRTNGLNINKPSSPLQPDVTSSINKDINVEPPIKKSSEMLHNFLHRPLKRKALDEDADRSLKPQLKRVSISPTETRNVGIIVQTEFSNQETKTDNTTKELINDSPRTIINMAKLEIPITETDDNVEKAEGYTKEVENICNSLRKKHEEVKELLVRAVVNNNTLLILNHPSYEDKILKLKKFAAKLTSETQHMLCTPTTVA